ncbi:MAG TPA: hypothetical protein VHU40_15670 [Polyangia bacterium]|nr:hypothetical protein [Polyangia bacterium]
MPDSPEKDPPGETVGGDAPPGAERITPGIADFVRRAVSAGVGAASRSKEDILRVASTEVKTWLDHMNFSEEITKALANMVIEVKTEIRFRPADGGKMVPQATNEVKMRNSDT